MRIPGRARVRATVALLALLVCGSGSMAGPVSAAKFEFNSRPWLNLALETTKYIPGLPEVAQYVAGPSSLNYSGNLTFLLVGSDWRQNRGERLDSILVMTITGSKQIRAVSIPRDSGRIPIAPSLGGGTYNGKINGMYQYFKNGQSRAVAMDKMVRQVEFLLGINIDYWGFVRFAGFDQLVDEVAGVKVDIDKELRDPKYIDKPGWPTGARFVVENDANLRGADAERCYGGYPKPVTNWGPVMHCHRALVWVRSRKGGFVDGGTNNDYKRSARQQRFIFDAIRRVTGDYGSGITASLRSRANAMPNDISTNMPMDDGSLVALYNKLKGSTFAGGAVFSPPTYAKHISGTSKNQLRLDVIRSLCNSWFDDA